MCGPVALGAVGLGASVVGSVVGARAQRHQMEHQAAIADNNATIAGWQRTDALRRGRRDESFHRLQTAQRQSRQAAALAANGHELGSGSALRLLADTDFIGELEALDIRDNAAREAYGHQVTASNFRGQAASLRAGASNISPLFAGALTALGGGSRLYSQNRYFQTRANGAAHAADMRRWRGAGAGWL